MNNKIENPKTEVPTSINLNDKDYIMNLLNTLKEMSKNYSTAMTEASNESLYKGYISIFNKITELQRETYELMFRKGWYSLEKSEQQKITDKYNMLNQEYKNLEI